jgi:hypothetical protein
MLSFYVHLVSRSEGESHQSAAVKFLPLTKPPSGYVRGVFDLWPH